MIISGWWSNGVAGAMVRLRSIVPMGGGSKPAGVREPTADLTMPGGDLHVAAQASL